MKLKKYILLAMGLSILLVNGCSQETEVTTTRDKPKKGILLPTRITTASLPAGSMAAYLYMDQDTTPLASKPIGYSSGQTTVSFTNVPVSPGDHTFTISFKFLFPGIELTILASASTGVLNIQKGSATPINFDEENYSYPDDDDDDISNIAELERGSNHKVVNRAPSVTLTNTNLSIDENIATIATITADDPDQDLLQYTIAQESEDQSLFSVANETGVLSFISAPDYEFPKDTGNDNVYNIDVVVSDGYLSDVVTLIVTIDNVIEFPQPPELDISGAFKQLQFSWTESNEATTTYTVMQNPDGKSGFTTLTNNLTTLSYTLEVAVHLTDWLNASYVVEACNQVGCVNSNKIGIDNLDVNSIGYVKASNTEAEDQFSYAIALSGDGRTLVVGAPWEDSNADGIDGNEGDNNMEKSGAVYVFVRNGTTWQQQAYIKASNPDGWDQFGFSVSLSADGNTLAVGALWEDSATTGVNNPPDVNDPNGQANDHAWNAGAVYVFIRNGTTWEQQAYVKASNTDASNTAPEDNDRFGRSVALSADGNTLAVGASFESSIATGVNTPPDVNDPNGQANNDAPHSGVVYVYTRSGITWEQQAYIKASNSGQNDEFGYSVALNEDGTTLTVGARGEASDTIDDETNNNAPFAGAAYVFARSGTTWQKQAYIKASNAAQYHWFGFALDLSDDGNTLAVGAIAEGIDAPRSGAVYMFFRSGGNWVQQTMLKALNAYAQDEFGFSISLSGDGSTLAVGAHYEDSNAVGVNGDHTNNDADAAGAAYVFRYNGTSWRRYSYIKASNTDAKDSFGTSIALDRDGNTLAVGARLEDSGATGINGDQTDQNTLDAGAVYLY